MSNLDGEAKGKNYIEKICEAYDIRKYMELKEERETIKD